MNTVLSVAERLGGFDTATLHESGAQGTITSDIRMLSGDRRLAGPALTVLCAPGDNLIVHVAIARSKPGVVLVVQCQDPRFGVWGEVMTVAAMARGVAGLVLDGSVRDLAAIRRHGFPIFARGTALRGAAKAARGTIGQPIGCGGAAIWADDFIVADESGIVAIRPADAEMVVKRAEERNRKEAIIMDQLRAGLTTIELLGLDERLAHG